MPAGLSLRGSSFRPGSRCIKAMQLGGLTDPNCTYSVWAKLSQIIQISRQRHDLSYRFSQRCRAGGICDRSRCQRFGLKRISEARRCHCGGRGSGSKFVRVLVDWVFENTQAHRLRLDAIDYNVRARHVYTKLASARKAYFGSHLCAPTAVG
jgi:RimJ/RimL family protein N-acetyltransferase